MRFSYNPIPRPHVDKQSGYEQSLVSWSISVQELNCSMIRWLKILNEMKLPGFIWREDEKPNNIRDLFSEEDKKLEIVEIE